MAAAFIRSVGSAICGAARAGHGHARHGATPLMRARHTGAPPAAATDNRPGSHAGRPHSTHLMLAQDL